VIDEWQNVAERVPAGNPEKPTGRGWQERLATRSETLILLSGTLPHDGKPRASQAS